MNRMPIEDACPNFSFSGWNKQFSFSLLVFIYFEFLLSISEAVEIVYCMTL